MFSLQHTYYKRVSYLLRIQTTPCDNTYNKIGNGQMCWKATDVIDWLINWCHHHIETRQIQYHSLVYRTLVGLVHIIIVLIVFWNKFLFINKLLELNFLTFSLHEMWSTDRGLLTLMCMLPSQKCNKFLLDGRFFETTLK